MRLRLLPDSSPLGWTPYAWLVYVSYFVLYSVLTYDSPVDLAIDGAGLAIFFVLYFRGFWVSGAALLQTAFALVALGAALSPRNPGASSFFVYGAAFLGAAARPAVAWRYLMLIVLVIGAEAWIVPLAPQAWMPGILFSLLIGATNIHEGEMRRKDASLIAAHKTAERLATVAERERIARDLHDLLGHTLSVIVIKSELASKLAETDPVRAAGEIRDVERISRNALQEVRRAIHGYRGERVETELATARAALDAAGVTLVQDIEPVALTPDIERALALALREAVTNVIRHARARRCEVVLRQDSSGLRLVVTDDGIGGEHEEGAGLSGMRTRLAAIGGTVERDGRRGTRLTLAVPDRQPALSRELAAS